ncbi:MAG: hypothetical protein K0U68_02140 [Gammaproteobacteria bacterium]|nr:hypothetical protein [Gammaproteobacteria bacterium]
MNYRITAQLDLLVYIFFLNFQMGCNESVTQSSEGIEDFFTVSQQSLTRLEKGEITRNRGFNTECAVDIKRDRGIRISETVCDKADFRSITIRITDPTSRPPSQKIRSIQLTTLTDETVTTKKGETQTTSSGVVIKLDRSGQSVILSGQQEATS